MLENLRAPLSEDAFLRFAQKYRLTAKGARLYGVVSTIIVLLFLGAAIFMLGFAAEWHLLKGFGAEAIATRTATSTHVEVGRHEVKTPYEKIEYAFTTYKGQVIHGVIDRPTIELPGIDSPTFPVVYWGQVPSVNIPQEFQPPYAQIYAISVFLLACTLYFVLFARRSFKLASDGGFQDNALAPRR